MSRQARYVTTSSANKPSARGLIAAPAAAVSSSQPLTSDTPGSAAY